MLYGQCAEPCRIKQERMRTQSAKQFVIVHNRGQDLAKKKKSAARRPRNHTRRRRGGLPSPDASARSVPRLAVGNAHSDEHLAGAAKGGTLGVHPKGGDDQSLQSQLAYQSVNGMRIEIERRRSSSRSSGDTKVAEHEQIERDNKKCSAAKRLCSMNYY